MTDKNEGYKYNYSLVIPKKPDNAKEAISNYMHPDHHIFTYEYGWIRIDELYSMTKEKRQLNILQFDLTDWKMYYTNKYEVVVASTNKNVHHLVKRYNKVEKSEIELKVYKFCELILSLDGESLTRMRSIDYMSNYVRPKIDHDVRFISLNTIKSLHRGENIDFSKKIWGKAIPYQSRLYGIVNQTGALLTMFNGKISLIGCYGDSHETYRLWQ